jgi:hypothetical protein
MINLNNTTSTKNVVLSPQRSNGEWPYKIENWL